MAIKLVFDVKVESYGSLTIDNLAITGLQPQSPGTAPGLPQPPLNQVVLGGGPTGAGPNLTTAQQQEACISNPWGLWFVNLVNRINQATGQQGSTVNLTFECPSIDDSDVAFFGSGTIDATTDPVTFTAATMGTSIYGRALAVGDYILWDDPIQVGGNSMYEIDQVTAIAGLKITLQRSAKGMAGSAAAQFGTKKFGHSSRIFFPLLDKFFHAEWDGTPAPLELPWYNKTVAAVVATLPGLPTPTLVLLFPPAPGSGNPVYTPTYPGLRTLVGNMYCIPMGAALTVGAIADFWLPVTGPESIRSVFGKLSVAGLGGISQIYVLYRTPDFSAAGLIDILNFAAGAVTSYDLTSNRPDQRRQMPYHDGWPPLAAIGLDYPPTLLPTAVSALLPNGDINPAYGAAPGISTGPGSVVFQEGGAISFVCTKAPTGGGTSPGQVDVVTVQT